MAPKRIVEILAEAYSAPFKCRGERSGLNKKKPRAGVAEICGQNGSAVVKSGRRTKVRASFAVAPQTAKVTATVRGTCSVKVEKASGLWAEDAEGSTSRRDASSLCRDGSEGPTPRPVTPEHALPVRGARTRGQLGLVASHVVTGTRRGRTAQEDEERERPRSLSCQRGCSVSLVETSAQLAGVAVGSCA